MPNTAPTSLQTSFWNEWNATTRAKHLDEVSLRQSRVVTSWLQELCRCDLDILEVGSGACWFCEQLSAFGQVTGTDLSNEVLSQAQPRLPQVKLIAGDFMALEFDPAGYDVIITLEVLSHVADQRAFVAKLSSHLRPGGLLLLATQNRPVLQRYNYISPPAPGQLRRWFDKDELRELLSEHLLVEKIFSVTPRANKGILRILNSPTFNWPIRAVLGDRIERLKESAGLGWTLMARARKPT